MKTVLVAAQKGGVGKTFLANELAYSLERSGVPFNFYELDPQGGGAHDTAEVDGAEYAIVDTPGHLDKDMSDQLREADIIVIPTRASMTDMGPLQRMMALVEKYAPGTPVIVVVNEWNRFTASTQYTDWLKKEIRGENTQLKCVPHSEAVPRSGMEDTAAVIFAKRNGQKNAAYYIATVINAVRRMLGLEAEDLGVKLPQKSEDV